MSAAIGTRLRRLERTALERALALTPVRCPYCTVPDAEGTVLMHDMTFVLDQPDGTSLVACKRCIATWRGFASKTDQPMRITGAIPAELPL
jgi:hypothetical protein